MLNAIIAGLSWGVIGGGLMALGGWALARRMERRSGEPRKQTAEDRAFDASMAAQLREFEGWSFEDECIQALRSELGGGLLHMAEGTFSSVWAKPGLEMGGEYAPDYRIFPVVRGAA